MSTKPLVCNTVHIGQVRAELFHTDGRTDGQTYITKLIGILATLRQAPTKQVTELMRTRYLVVFGCMVRQAPYCASAP
jgi:hypothetical protein